MRFTLTPIVQRIVRFTLVIAIGGTLIATGRSAGAVDPSHYLPGSGQHHLHHKALPPGQIWKSPHAVQAGPAYFQPVAFHGPEGVTFDLPQNGAQGKGEANLMAGLLVGGVYRFRITNIPQAAGAELYPTVELIDRTFPPPGLATSFPVPINLSDSDIREAMSGNLVTRVIYLEDPQTAVPLAQESTSDRALDIREYDDALAVADEYGRPIAILRIGSVSPPQSEALKPQFYFGYPAWAPIFQSQPSQ